MDERIYIYTFNIPHSLQLSGYTPIGNLYSKVRHILYSIKCRIKGNGPECEYLFLDCTTPYVQNK